MSLAWLTGRNHFMDVLVLGPPFLSGEMTLQLHKLGNSLQTRPRFTKASVTCLLGPEAALIAASGLCTAFLLDFMAFKHASSSRRS